MPFSTPYARYCLAKSFKKSAGPGFEPGYTVPETAVLPLDDPAPNIV